jgi:hypothetical protein
MNELHFRELFLKIAVTGQTGSHAPQSMQVSGSI